MDFIYQLERKDLDEYIELSVYSIDEKNKIKIKKIKYDYTFFVSEQDFNTLNMKSDKIIQSNEIFMNKTKEKILKVAIKNKELYEYILSQLKDNTFPIYEGDLNLESKYLIEKGMEIFTNKENNPQDLKLKYVSIDIETKGNIENLEIVSISTYSPFKEGFNKVYINKEFLDFKRIENEYKKIKNKFDIVPLENEKEVLKRFRDDIIKLEPQIILGWNVIDFDFKVIRDRMKYHNLEFKFSDSNEECKLRIFTDFFRDSSLICSKVLVFDVIQLLRANYIVFEDYKLDTVAKEVLKEKKIEVINDDENIEDKILAIETMIKNDPFKLVEYNFKDSYLTAAIVEKLKLLELMMQRSIITGAPLSRVKSPIATLDIMYLKELHKRGYVAPSNFNFTQSAPIEGAYVLSPKRDFYEDIFVLDFKSLYPSIIMTFNIDPFTYDENGKIDAPNGAKFIKERGILPQLILKLYKERDIAKKEKNSVKSYALKTTMNSFYGAMASPKSRFYNKEVGGAITAFGREIIKTAKKFIEERGHNVVYGDTDSIFIKFDRKFKSLDEKKKFGKQIESDLNDFFEKWVKKHYDVENFLKIEFEKLFSKFFIASKKRYVGYDEFSKKINFTGMEAIRGDWSELAKNFQVKLIELIFDGKNKKEIEKFILEYVEDLKKGKFDDLLIYKKKITKPLVQYTKTTPPHVRAAREFIGFSGRLVKYVMTDKGPKHVSILILPVNYDYEHYISKQLKGVSDDILETFGIDFDEVLNKKVQKSLDRFF